MPAARGLTLLEILVVIGILVLLMGLVIGGVDRIGGVRLRNETNKVAAAIRHTFNRSVSLGLYMRMVIDLDGESYTVEGSERPTFLREKPVEVGIDPDSAQADQPGKKGKSKDDAASRKVADQIAARRASFTQDDVIGQQKLEGGAAFDSVIVAGQTDPQSSGKAYLHFFPHGWVEPAYVYTTDGEGTYYTLQVHPLTGKVTRQSGKVDPDRHFAEPEKTEEEGD